MDQLFKAIGKVTSPWSLAAFGIAAIVYLVLKKRGKIPALGWLCIFTIALTPMLASLYLDVFRISSERTGLYRVRITVLGPQQIPIEDAKVWSSLGGEPKRVSAGWEFDIPAALKPANGKVTVFAAVPNAYLSGSTEVALGNDYNPPVILQLNSQAFAPVHGVVINEDGKGVEGATVRAVGYETDASTTGKGGQFSLLTHAHEGQQVLLQADKDGYKAVTQNHPAGDEPVTIVLSRK